MPFYVYECSAGHKTEELRKVDNRHDPTTCDTCGKAAKLAVQPVALDNYGMGVDPAFPTAYARWGKSQARRARDETKRNS